MAIDAIGAWTPGWWLDQLSRKLERRRPALDLLSSYYDGKPPLPTSAENARSAYAAFQKKAQLNLAELSTEAVLNRMTPTGLDCGDQAGNKKLARLWTANDLDVEHAEVHRHMLVRRNGYVMVGGPAADTGVPVVTAEDPRQVITIHDPARQNRVRAGAKFFHDPELEMDIAYLYVPGRVFRAFRQARYQIGTRPIVAFTATSWDWDTFYGGPAGLPVPGNRVGIVRFRNKEGKGDFETHLDVIDRTNHAILQRMVIMVFQAFKQRAIKIDPEEMPTRDPNTDQIIDYDKIFSSDPGAMWKLPASAEMWESAATDIRPIIDAAKQDVQDYCAMTGTPLYYADPKAGDGSAEGAQTMREAITYKADDRVKRANAGWRQVASIALEYMGDKRADSPDLRALWLPTERFSLSERSDAASKAGTDLPWAMKMEKIWQLSPQEIEAARPAHEEEVATAKAAAAVPPPVVVPADNVGNQPPVTGDANPDKGATA